MLHNKNASTYFSTINSADDKSHLLSKRENSEEPVSQKLLGVQMDNFVVQLHKSRFNVLFSTVHLNIAVKGTLPPEQTHMTVSHIFFLLIFIQL